MRLAWLAALPAALLVAGCLTPASSVGRSGLAGPDAPMQWAKSAYWDATTGAGTMLERSIRHLGGGPTSGGLHYHTLDEVKAHIEELNATWPGLVDVEVLGESRLGRPVWDVVLTDEAVPAAGKLVPILDGAHHGNEYAGGELMMYAADLLLDNYATNATVRGLLHDLEIHVVPVVNPDGWVAATRYNGFGVNLNRNYDIDWGDPLGTSNPVMGEIGAAANYPIGGVALAAENCGASAASEPETQAMVALFKSTKDRASFYLSGHTATHAVIAPWAAFMQPGPLPSAQSAVLESELQWVRDNTEYQAGKAQWGNLSAGLPYAASGSSMDYYYTAVGKPAFTVEVEYEVTSATDSKYPVRLLTPVDTLQTWMRASAALPMHLLANAQELAAWQTPDRPALVPASMGAQAQQLEPAYGQPHL
jgi:hypothetical protein